MAKPSPWRDFYKTAISRHGDTHRHLATRINLWRHPSPYGDTFPDLATGVAKARQPLELDHILHSVSNYAVQEMATAMLSLLFSRALVILVALPRYASPSRNSSRDSATALVVQCKLSRLCNRPNYHGTGHVLFRPHCHTIETVVCICRIPSAPCGPRDHRSVDPPED